MQLFVVALVLHLPLFVASQQIWDIWQTTYNGSSLFKSLKPSPINFVTPTKANVSADIAVNDKAVFQPIDGFGATLTDSSAYVLNNLKLRSSANYTALLKTLFDGTEGANAAGFTMLRVPLGASYFSANIYSFDDTAKNTNLSHFNINVAPSYLFSVIKDILVINPALKVQVVPWSPPGWMKNTQTMKGGSLNTTYISIYATYLLKCLQGFKSKGITAWAIAIQNEPLYSTTSYPTTSMPVAVEAQIGLLLRPLMNKNGFTNTKLIGFEHNWQDALGYPIQLMKAAASAFEGVSFHCYAGNVTQQDNFTAAYPLKSVYFTECASLIGTDWWSDIKWESKNIFVGALQHGARTGMMWTLAGNSTGGPKLPGTQSCGGTGCRPVVTVINGTYQLNQEFYGMAQASKAIIPRDKNGPFGQRIGFNVSGNLSAELTVGAYVTKRVKSTDWLRYSLVVINQYNASTIVNVTSNGSSTTNGTAIVHRAIFIGRQDPGNDNATDTNPINGTVLTNGTITDGSTPANVTIPIDGSTPTNGTVPTDGSNPTNGTTPGDGSNPTNGTIPIDGSNPTNGTTPINGTTPTNGTTPGDGTTPGNGTVPIGGNPGNSTSSGNGTFTPPVIITYTPQPIKATITFRGKQATYVFPVGVTTLWWYALAPAPIASPAVKGKALKHRALHKKAAATLH